MLYKFEGMVLQHHRDLDNGREKYSFRCMFPSRPDGKGLILSVESTKKYDSLNGSKEILLALKSVNDRNHIKGPESRLENIPL